MLFLCLLSLNLLTRQSSSTEALDRLNLKTLSKRRHFHRCVMMHTYLSGEIDFNFDIRRNSSFHSYQTRGSNDLHLPRVCINRGKQTFIYQASMDWNNLDNNTVANRCHFLRPSLKAYNLVNDDLSNYCFSFLISFLL